MRTIGVRRRRNETAPRLSAPAGTGQTFETAAVTRMLGVSGERVRTLVHAGVCHPQRIGRKLRFTFQDLVQLRAWLALAEARIPMARLRRAADALAEHLAPGRPLSGIRVYADGGQVVVRDGRTLWQPDSGQLLFSFAIDSAQRNGARQVSKLRHDIATTAAMRRGRRDNARVSFERALRLEARGDLLGAEAAYQEAIERDPDMVDAYINFGRLAHDRQDIETASQFYEKALALAPHDAVVHYNLALTFEDKKSPVVAITHYMHAIEADPEFADAHFNLARLFETCGRRADALRHLLIYRRLMEA